MAGNEMHKLRIPTIGTPSTAETFRIVYVHIIIILLETVEKNSEQIVLKGYQYQQ